MKSISASEYASILGTRIVLVLEHQEDSDFKIILDKNVDPKTFVKKCWRHKLPIIVKNRSLYCSKEFPFDRKKSFLDALYEKYGNSSPLISSLNLKNGKQIEFCGFQDIKSLQADFQRLKIVILENLQISSVDTEVDHGSILSGVQKLNLSSNLLNSMNDVLFLCSQLPSLNQLILDKNKYLSLDEFNPKFSNPQVSSLFLRDCSIRSEELGWIQKAFPCLNELFLDYNDVELNSNCCLMSTETLSLSYNTHLVTADLTSFPVFERTKWLNISFNNISDLNILPLENMQYLSFLDISGNNINSWDQIALLQTLKSLKELRLSLSKLHDKTDETRMLVIARLPSLMKLNDVSISKSEREDSEIYYSSCIRKFVLENEISKADTLDNIEPIWRYIWKKHGLSEPEFYRIQKIDKKPGVIKDNIIRDVCVSCSEGNEHVVLQFHQNWTVLSVKALIAFRFNLRAFETIYQFKGQEDKCFRIIDSTQDEKQLYELPFTITEVRISPKDCVGDISRSE
ncbi:tubulin specific chaperone cofactor E [Schizosaccharomyces cryophilus OY26]|uniref:Tubulin specific chaperone cofactor E n=1 Tax=Schizosaccharomyces cryophilus (strain OY26 / ATCC MYA-4695 / CBS 11777 / NBRC 106824 / NRRL Y48691) TaxID=653667 RepID=S9XDN3_SCHCR|nr:tubulin specific chaperone cofactor E [Schizosaccharomyces cryophilus OY26]EPY51861.1 tubulin specific chaperone cofactor E [Schizosaccharomyces cryophilus OY26]